MDGNVILYFKYKSILFDSLVNFFEKSKIYLINKNLGKTLTFNDGGFQKISLEDIKREISKENNEFNFKFWITTSSDIFTNIKRRDAIIEFSFSVDGLYDDQIDIMLAALDKFIYLEKSNFLERIDDLENLHEEIDWFPQIIEKYKNL